MSELEADNKQANLEDEVRRACTALLDYMRAATVVLPPNPKNTALLVVAGDPLEIRKMSLPAK